MPGNGLPTPANGLSERQLIYTPVVATCPYCGKFLDRSHRCGGPWRQRRRTVGALMTGAALGGTMAFAVSDQPTGLLVSVTALLGAVLIWSFWRYV